MSFCIDPIYDIVSSDSDSETEITIQRICGDMSENGVRNTGLRSYLYTGYGNLPYVGQSFTKVNSISTLYRCMFEYKSPRTQETYLAKVTCVEKSGFETRSDFAYSDRTFLIGYEMESLVYHTLSDQPCVSKRVSWKEVVPKNEPTALVYIESTPVKLDFGSWAQNIDFEYEHFSVIVMKKKANSITIREFITNLFKQGLKPLGVSTIMEDVFTRIISKMNDLNHLFSFVHCDLKSDNILINETDNTDITFIDFDLSSIKSMTSENQTYYSNPEHILAVSQNENGVLFDIFRLYTSLSSQFHIPLFHDKADFSNLHSILCISPFDRYVKKMERHDSDYNFLNDGLYFNKWCSDTNVTYERMMAFITLRMRGLEHSQYLLMKGCEESVEK